MAVDLHADRALCSLASKGYIEFSATQSSCRWESMPKRFGKKRSAEERAVKIFG